MLKKIKEEVLKGITYIYWEKEKGWVLFEDKVKKVIKLTFQKTAKAKDEEFLKIIDKQFKRTKSIIGKAKYEIKDRKYRNLFAKQFTKLFKEYNEELKNEMSK